VVVSVKHIQRGAPPDHGGAFREDRDAALALAQFTIVLPSRIGSRAADSGAGPAMRAFASP
jgi:hypothetical protein